MFETNNESYEQRRTAVLAKKLLEWLRKTDPLFRITFERVDQEGTEDIIGGKAKTEVLEIIELGMIALAEEWLQAVDEVKPA